ncbi:MAG: hypothetical protein K0S86_3913, partial [Geminicoccaceae bacterium]|nr:hypothetical protein [Geminicoccaceae bacterium]
TGVWLGVVAIGVGLRVTQYAANRSLWVDEAMLALNIAARPATELLRPLDYAQSAPPLFLFGERGVVRLAGVNELTLRALPFIAGIALFLVLWPLARRIIGPTAALFAIAIAALSPLLTYYANEVKPYGIDALVTVMLVSGAVRVFDAPDEAVPWRALAAAGTVAVWASSPAVFVLAGVAAALIASSRVRRTERFLRRTSGTLLLWGASFGTVFITTLRHSSDDPYLNWFFEGTFLTPTAPRFLLSLQIALGSALNEAFFSRDLFDATMPSALYAFLALALGLCLIGLIAIWRRCGAPTVIVLAGPMAVAFAASAVRLYPSSPPRFMGFAVPLLAIMVAAGTAVLMGRIPLHARSVGSVLFAVLFLTPSAYRAGRVLRDPYATDDNARAVIRAFEQSPRAREAVYITSNGVPRWLFYTTDWNMPDTARLAFYGRVSRSPDGPAKQNRPRRGRPVSREGFELTIPYRGRREIVGLFSGVAVRPVFKDRTTNPDDGWAANEAERIRTAAEPCATVMALGISPPEIEALHAALGQLGGQSALVRSAAPTHQAYVCFAKGDGARRQ